MILRKTAVLSSVRVNFDIILVSIDEGSALKKFLIRRKRDEFFYLSTTPHNAKSGATGDRHILSKADDSVKPEDVRRGHKGEYPSGSRK